MKAAWTLSALVLVLAGCSETPEGPPEAVTVEAHESPAPRFEPANVTVALAGTVTFRVASGHHTVDFSTVHGLSSAHSGELGAQSPFAVQFTQPGTYSYHCQVHAGMTGVVHVQ